MYFSSRRLKLCSCSVEYRDIRRECGLYLLLLSGCEKFWEGVTHLVLHTICPIAPIGEQSASAVMWTCSRSSPSFVKRCQRASDEIFDGPMASETLCPVLNTHSNPPSITHTHFVQQMAEHAGEEGLMLERVVA